MCRFLFIAFYDYDRWGRFSFLHGCVYAFLGTISIGFIILTILFASLWLKSDLQLKPNIIVNSTIFVPNCTTNLPIIYAVEKGIIDFPPRLPDDGNYVQWTFLQMNDVYELSPLNQARVAYLRQLLLEENNNTITVLTGNLLSSSTVGAAKVNGITLNGKQLNTLGLDYMTFGNHEFDLNKEDLMSRMNESTFTWINSNVFHANTTQLFGPSISHKLITIDGVRILLIGLTINRTVDYVHIIDQSSLVNYTKEFLRSFPNETYDVLIALTHLDITTDIQLATKIPQIDLIIGRHEHENYYELQGDKYTPISKVHSNACTVYIHRCAFNIDTKRFRTYSTIAQVLPEVSEEEEEEKTSLVAKYWLNLGIEGFASFSYQPLQIISCLPPDIELDGKYESVTSSNTLLTDAMCESLVQATVAFGTTIGLVNSGTIRIDDVIRETITQYDILRTLPFSNNVVALSVPGKVLAQVLTTGMSVRGTGMFINYIGIETTDQGITWFVNGVNIATNNLTYKVATTTYLRENTELNSTVVTVLKETDETQAEALIDYLLIKYPPC